MLERSALLRYITHNVTGGAISNALYIQTCIHHGHCRCYLYVCPKGDCHRDYAAPAQRTKTPQGGCGNVRVTPRYVRAALRRVRDSAGRTAAPAGGGGGREENPQLSAPYGNTTETSSHSETRGC